jgi:hypothetical protein
MSLPSIIERIQNLFLYLETGFVNERGDNIMLAVKTPECFTLQKI